MKKQSLSFMIFLMTCFVIISLGIAGCTSQAPAASKTSTIEPSEIILQPSEIPVNFTLLEKGERNVSDMSEWSLDHGWKKGYYAVFLNNDPNAIPGTVIEQYISVYTAENITLIVPDTVSGWKNWTVEENDANLSFEELSLPAIGDSSAAMKVTNTSDMSQMYSVSFTKKDVYQQFMTNGTATDYETVKQLAGIAAAKIK
ncbi:MAG: hypothetical protein CVV30_08585 [Methanomicrobiales archaeon HGW-Methanomicrobiales-1]|jgi:hypothetical protein|nr:MAG: hypothetical protein CVV30_08585 [Methanomicrobiales archaeon HGW-Methanomicrobiales-1]